MDGLVVWPEVLVVVVVVLGVAVVVVVVCRVLATRRNTRSRLVEKNLQNAKHEEEG